MKMDGPKPFVHPAICGDNGATLNVDDSNVTLTGTNVTIMETNSTTTGINATNTTITEVERETGHPIAPTINSDVDPSSGTSAGTI